MVWFTFTALIVAFSAPGNFFHHLLKSQWIVPTLHQTADRHSWQLAGQHSGSFSCKKNQTFPTGKRVNIEQAPST